jgi:hydroxymethylpyrimidine pyrophosphatase-like HAD family hydrolase
VKSADGETHVRHLLPRGVAAAVLGKAPDHRESAALLFDRPREGQIVYERVEWDHPRHRVFFAANREFISEMAPLESALTEDPLQLMFTGGCVEMRELFERLRVHDNGDPTEAATASALHAARPVAAVSAAAGIEACSVTLTEYVHRDFSLVDIIRAGCSKGAALGEWATRRGISHASVMAVGDNLNDLRMLELAGYPVVMANALPELKARGWKVTSSNDDAGVALAIDAILEARGSVQDR